MKWVLAVMSLQAVCGMRLASKGLEVYQSNGSIQEDAGDERPSIKVANGDWIGDDQWQGSHDFVVQIRIVTKTCTGTVIGDVVITAAHCMKSKRRPNGISASDIRVQTTSLGWTSIVKFAKHPDYVEKTKKNDVAILWLPRTHQSQDDVRLSTRRMKTRDVVSIAGFGKTERGGMGYLHDSGPMKIISCPSWVPSSHKCAGSGSGSDVGSCGGDSGGPWYKKAGKGRKEKVFLIGVNSFGMNGKCGETSKKTGFTYIANRRVKDWLKKEVPQLRWGSY